MRRTSYLTVGVICAVLMACVALSGCPSSTPTMVSAPGVEGMTQAGAEGAILGAGLTVGAVTQAYSDSVPEGHVISQSPTAGTITPQGSAVDLVVSLGGDKVHIEIPGAEIIFEGQVFDGAADVPPDALLGVMYEGQAYLYHPALPEGTELSRETSERAVGYWIIGMGSSDAKRRGKALDVEQQLFLPYTPISTGLSATHSDIHKFTFKNNLRRWAVVVSQSDPGNPVYLTPGRQKPTLNVVQALAESFGFTPTNSSQREITVDSKPIDTMGSTVRAWPLIKLHLVSVNDNDIPQYATDIYDVVNLCDYVHLVHSGVNSIVGLMPVDCAQLFLQNLIDQLLVYRVGVLTQDPQIIRQFSESMAFATSQNVVTCMDPGVTDSFFEFLDIITAFSWLIDDGLIGLIDAAANDAYAQFAGYSALDLRVGEEPAPSQIVFSPDHDSVTINVLNSGGWDLSWEASVANPALASLTYNDDNTSVTIEAADLTRVGETTTVTFTNISDPEHAIEIEIEIVGPQLRVDLEHVALTRASAYEDITLSNDGESTLRWRGPDLSEDPLLAIDKTSGEIEPGETEKVRISLKDPQSVSAYYELLLWFENVDIEFDRASVWVEVEPGLLNVIVPQGGTVKLTQDSPSATVTVRNLGLSPLSWQAEGYTGISVTPFSGRLDPGFEESVRITADDPNTIMNTTITFKNLENDKNTVNVPVSVNGEGPFNFLPSIVVLNEKYQTAWVRVLMPIDQVLPIQLSLVPSTNSITLEPQVLDADTVTPLPEAQLPEAQIGLIQLNAVSTEQPYSGFLQFTGTEGLIAQLPVVMDAPIYVTPLEITLTPEAPEQTITLSRDTGNFNANWSIFEFVHGTAPVLHGLQEPVLTREPQSGVLAPGAQMQRVTVGIRSLELSADGLGAVCAPTTEVLRVHANLSESLLSLGDPGYADVLVHIDLPVEGTWHAEKTRTYTSGSGVIYRKEEELTFILSQGSACSWTHIVMGYADGVWNSTSTTTGSGTWGVFWRGSTYSEGYPSRAMVSSTWTINWHHQDADGHSDSGSYTGNHSQDGYSAQFFLAYDAVADALLAHLQFHDYKLGKDISRDPEDHFEWRLTRMEN